MSAWQPIKTRPTDEHQPFLVLTPMNSIADYVVLQVTVFEGRMYPDHLDGNIDWVDGVENATHWAPVPEGPEVPIKARAKLKARTGTGSPA